MVEFLRARLNVGGRNLWDALDALPNVRNRRVAFRQDESTRERRTNRSREGLVNFKLHHNKPRRIRLPPTPLRWVPSSTTDLDALE